MSKVVSFLWTMLLLNTVEINYKKKKSNTRWALIYTTYLLNVLVVTVEELIEDEQFIKEDINS